MNSSFCTTVLIAEQWRIKQSSLYACPHRAFVIHQTAWGTNFHCMLVYSLSWSLSTFLRFTMQNQGKTRSQRIKHKEKAFHSIKIIDMVPSIRSALIPTHLPFNLSYRKEVLVQKLKVSFPCWATNERRSQWIA